MRFQLPETMIMDFDNWTVLIRLGLTVLLCGIIGWERERLRKPAGFRTHILVGVGSCLLISVLLKSPGSVR